VKLQLLVLLSSRAIQTLFFVVSVYNADAHLAPPFVIPSPMKEPSGRWFLARSADGKRLMIIHEDRYIRSNDHLEPAEVLHDGNGLILRECPAPVIHIFEKDLSLIGPNWSRVDSLGTHSLFIGLNYPMNLKINDGNAPDGTLTPFMRSNCVYIAYYAFREPAFSCICRCNLQQGENELMGVITLPEDGWGFPRQATMWFKPSLKNIRMLMQP
jgi:hypothetical protein